MILNPRKRVRIAYHAAFKVIFSYRLLKWKSWFFGASYYKKNINNLHLKNGIYIKDTILELKGLFIKIGQLISALSNVLPIEFRSPLEELQDRVTPIPFDGIKNQTEKERGRKFDEIFRQLNKEPLATASIGQTHRGFLHNGDEIVLKIQHPEIEVIAETDLGIIRKLMKFAAKRLKMRGIFESYDEIEKMIHEELDYNAEASRLIEFTELLKEEDVVVPEVYKQYTSERMLVMSYEEGIKINDLDELDRRGVDRPELAKQLVALFAKMIFEDGRFHADPHPGNVLFNSNNKIVLLDFGAVGNLTEEMREGIAELILAVVEMDSQKITKALMKMGFVISDEEAENLSNKIIEIGVEFLKSEVEINGLNIDRIHLKSGKGAIFKLMKKIDIRNLGDAFQIPADWILLQRTMVLIIGLCNELDSEFNPMNELKPYLQKYLMGKKTRGKMLVDFVKKQISSLLQLPIELNKFLAQANSGKLSADNSRLEKIQLMKHHFNKGLICTIVPFVFYYVANRQFEFSPWQLNAFYFGSIIFLLMAVSNLFRSHRLRKEIGH